MHPDFAIVYGLQLASGSKSNRIKCKRKRGRIEVLYQLYDEIIVKLKFTNRRNICQPRRVSHTTARGVDSTSIPCKGS